jgi:hypothetical protein
LSGLPVLVTYEAVVRYNSSRTTGRGVDHEARVRGNPKPETWLPHAELRDRLIEQAQADPIVLNESDYREWLSHTLLSRSARAEKGLTRIRAALENMTEGAGVDGKDAQLALEELDNVVVSLQYMALKHNSGYISRIDGRPAYNVQMRER